MAKPITATLRKALEGLAHTAPDARLPVVVTVVDAGVATHLQALGMVVEQQVPDPPIVMGMMTPAQALGAVRVAGVVALEIDNADLHALGRR